MLTVPLTDVKSADICVSWTSEAVKKKSNNSSEASSIAGRPLLVADPLSEELHLVGRDGIPPHRQAHFVAGEPFTILGVDPTADHSEIAATASAKFDLWLKLLGDQAKYKREWKSLENAHRILSHRESLFRYRGFVKKVYDPSRKQVTLGKLQRSFAKAIVSCVPELRSRQTLHDVKAGSGFGFSVLIAAVLLVAVLTIPVGGITILGVTLFAKTLIVTWGPLAVLPALAVLTTGGLAAYWYHQHADVFRKIHEALGEAFQQIEALGGAIEDVFLLRGFDLFEKNSREFHGWRRQAEKKRDELLELFIAKFVSAFVDQLVVTLSQAHQGPEITADEFFQFLADHPHEVRSSFKRALYVLVLDHQENLLQLQYDPGR